MTNITARYDWLFDKAWRGGAWRGRFVPLAGADLWFSGGEMLIVCKVARFILDPAERSCLPVGPFLFSFSILQPRRKAEAGL